MQTSFMAFLHAMIRIFSTNSSQNSNRFPDNKKCRKVDEFEKAFVQSFMSMSNPPESEFDPGEKPRYPIYMTRLVKKLPLINIYFIKNFTAIF